MIDVEGFKQLVQALQQRGYAAATAETYAALIGDTPEEDAAGQWVIRDEQGKILDTIAPLVEQS